MKERRVNHTWRVAAFPSFIIGPLIIGDKIVRAQRMVSDPFRHGDVIVVIDEIGAADKRKANRQKEYCEKKTGFSISERQHHSLNISTAGTNRYPCFSN